MRPTSDFFQCPEVLQFLRVHGWDVIVRVSKTANQNKSYESIKAKHWKKLPRLKTFYFYKSIT